ncbi:aspartate kinase [Alicyclobacillus sp. ALC3]|uniref:aspartate kinase n=1 Tax=Alicyclobacillus sp. ALC3 TaxID=2796143 RepID=UPI002379120A|nr:aspartate kinase [Alicyclobacillus sp. ALC3]WDL98542.1 aspartate kinase [Alicyclobacillus sp. ALC3]
MGLIVQKFGGTSLDSDEKRSAAVRHIDEARSEGHSVVVVVSAIGRKGEPYSTDTLLALVHDGAVSRRERDTLLACGEAISAVKFASCLESRGLRATVLSGQQAGIVTDDNYGNAEVLNVNPDRMLELVSRGTIPVVMGFQGASELGDVTTLGRGGSDITAVVLGAALKAVYVEIFTDVNGIMTADPRIVPEARHVTNLSYSEMYDLSSNGATVLHPSAVHLAAERKVPLRIRKTISDAPGTTILSHSENNEAQSSPNIKGIALTDKLVQISFSETSGDVRKFMDFDGDDGFVVEKVHFQGQGSVYIASYSNEDVLNASLTKINSKFHQVTPCSKITIVGNIREQREWDTIQSVISNALLQHDIDVLGSRAYQNVASYWFRSHQRGDAARIIHSALFSEMAV